MMIDETHEFHIDQLSEPIYVGKGLSRRMILPPAAEPAFEAFECEEPKPRTVGALISSLHDLREEHPVPKPVEKRLSDEPLPLSFMERWGFTFCTTIWCICIFLITLYMY